MALPAAFFLLTILSLTACADAPEIGKARANMTQRERDSTLAHSALPGSGVVRKAIGVSDSSASRAAAFDSLSEQ